MHIDDMKCTLHRLASREKETQLYTTLHHLSAPSEVDLQWMVLQEGAL